MRSTHRDSLLVAMLASISLSSFPIEASVLAPPPPTAPIAPAVPNQAANAPGTVFPPGQLDKQVIEKYVADSQKVVDAWLLLADQGRYGESWDAGSTTFKMTISRNEWIKAMETLRRPLGAVRSRKIIDIGNAENPKGLPQGEYMVYFYETQFDHKPKASELLTLVLESDNQWRLLTYQAL